MGTIEREVLWAFLKIHWTCHLAKINFNNKTKQNANEENGDKTDDENDPLSIANVNDDNEENKDKEENDKGIGAETGGSEDKDKTKKKADKEVRDKTAGDENNPIRTRTRTNNDKGIGVETSESADKNKPKASNAGKVVGDKTRDENDPLFNANGNSNNDDNDKDNDTDNIGMGGKHCTDGIKRVRGVPTKSPKRNVNSVRKHAVKAWGNRVPCATKRKRFVSGYTMKSPKKKKGIKAEGAKDARLYSNNKQALMILVEKKGKEELIRKGIKLADQTREHTLQEIPNVEDMTAKQLLRKDTTMGRKKPDYTDVSSDDNSNGKKPSDNENESEDKVDEAAKNKAIEPEEEEKNKAIEQNDTVQNKTTWKDCLPSLSSWWSR
eukprot:jgi/Psemu1/31278/gm1.31278_g